MRNLQSVLFNSFTAMGATIQSATVVTENFVWARPVIVPMHEMTLRVRFARNDAAP
jgi:hypothetical protein